ncbi:MAG: four helix bundle protein [bacterium]
MRDFKKLEVWEKAHNFVLEIYKVTQNFPQQERYGIINQLRRAAIGIANNIAEGCGRKTKNELYNFLNITMGSASEIEYLLLLSNDLNYLTNNFEEINNNLIVIKKC